MQKNKLMVALAVVVTAFLVAPSFSFAQSVGVSSIQAQIQTLLAELAQLQAQLAAQGGSAIFCYTFNSNIGIGATGIAVTNLQTALQKDGESVTVSGTYDETTASAVSAFQEKYRSAVLAPAGLSAGTGYVGAATRTKLNALFGCGTTTTPITSTTTSSIAPVITSISPTSATVGSQVTITGTNFGSSNIVFFNGYIVATSVSSNGTTMTFAVPSTLRPNCATAAGTACPQYLVTVTPGTYSVSVRTNNVTSNAVFLTVTSNSATTQTSTINILSPNGGETFTQGENNQISWSGGATKVQVGLAPSNFDPGNPVVLGWISLNSSPRGSVLWNAKNITDLTGAVNVPVNSGSYKIIVVSADANGNYCAGNGCNMDVSNAPFSVIAQNLVTNPIPPPVSFGLLNITTSATLPAATVGQAYPTTQLAATGGSGSYTWSVISTAQVPTGLSFSSAGVISGTPTTAGQDGFNVGVRDSLGNVATKIFYLNVASAPAVTVYDPTYSLSAPNGYVVGQPWTATITGAAPGSVFSMCGIHGSVVNVCTPNFGTTDANGNWSAKNTFTSGDVGAWTEWVQFGSTTSKHITFNVTATTQASPIYNSTYSISVPNGYIVGKTWTVSLANAQPNTTFSMCGTHGSTVNVCTPNFGTTNASGGWSTSGAFGSGDVGAWTEQIQFPNGQTSNQIMFNVSVTTTTTM